MKVTRSSLFAAAVSVSLAIFSSTVLGAPINNWAIDPSGAVTVVYGGLATDSPVIGDGTSNNANSGIITSSFPTISLLDGESISLSGSMTIAGAKGTGEDVGFQFGLMFEPGTVGNPVDDKGWLGYKADNSNATQSTGQLRARNTAGTNFATTTWISSAGSRDIVIDTEAAAGNGIFSSGTYSFGITVLRTGADVSVSGSILGTGATTFTNVFGPATVSTAAQKTFDFNRVGFWSVAPLDADQISFGGVDVTVVPEPNTAVILGMCVLCAAGFAWRKRTQAFAF
jgi:hypothetical protein